MFSRSCCPPLGNPVSIRDSVQNTVRRVIVVQIQCELFVAGCWFFMVQLEGMFVGSLHVMLTNSYRRPRSPMRCWQPKHKANI